MQEVDYKNAFQREVIKEGSLKPFILPIKSLLNVSNYKVAMVLFIGALLVYSFSPFLGAALSGTAGLIIIFANASNRGKAYRYLLKANRAYSKGDEGRALSFLIDSKQYYSCVGTEQCIEEIEKDMRLTSKMIWLRHKGLQETADEDYRGIPLKRKMVWRPATKCR